MSFVKIYSISFDVMYQISKKNIGAYSNITITKHYKFFYEYESTEASLLGDPTISKMELFVT